MDYRARQEQLAEKLRQKKLDALLVTYRANLRYLCGFTGSAGVLVMTPGRRLFFTDGRYREQARWEVQGARVVVSQRSALAAAARALTRLPVRAVGIESEHMPVAVRDKLKPLLPPKARLRHVAGLIEQQRMVKEPEEIERIRAAVLLASSLFDKVLEWIRPGVAESAIAAELEYAARRQGAQGMSFETIVAGGARSALPHGVASPQPIPNNGFVILDFGVILAGYCSDMTRTLYVGKPTARARRMYKAVREAQQAALEAVGPGVEAGEVDRAARKRLRRTGFARYFTHSTGHGVGLEIHEPPRLARGQREVLRPGMVVTIEPGIYIPGVGGVRIEDTVVVTEAGCEVLTPTTKELIAL